MVGDKKADPLAELTVRYEEAGVVQVEELGRAVLASSPLWATLAFVARERDPATGGFRPPRVTLRRYKKRGGRFHVDTHFTLTSAAQAQALVAALGGWLDGGALDASVEGADAGIREE